MGQIDNFPFLASFRALRSLDDQVDDSRIVRDKVDTGKFLVLIGTVFDCTFISLHLFGNGDRRQASV